MYYTIKKLKIHGSPRANDVAYSAELHAQDGKIIYAELTPNQQGVVVYNSKTNGIYPIVGVIEQKPLSEFKDGDIICLGECIEESK